MHQSSQSYGGTSTWHMRRVSSSFIESFFVRTTFYLSFCYKKYLMTFANLLVTCARVLFNRRVRLFYVLCWVRPPPAPRPRRSSTPRALSATRRTPAGPARRYRDRRQLGVSCRFLLFFSSVPFSSGRSPRGALPRKGVGAEARVVV